MGVLTWKANFILAVKTILLIISKTISFSVLPKTLTTAGLKLVCLCHTDYTQTTMQPLWPPATNSLTVIIRNFRGRTPPFTVYLPRADKPFIFMRLSRVPRKMCFFLSGQLSPRTLCAHICDVRHAQIFLLVYSFGILMNSSF